MDFRFKGRPYGVKIWQMLDFYFEQHILIQF